MKKSTLFLRRVNRGLLLGAVLLVALILYSVISAQLFRRVEKAAIEAQMREYLTAIADFHADFEAARYGHKLTSAEIDERMQDFAAFTAEYFAYQKSGVVADRGTQNVTEVEASYRDWLENDMPNQTLYAMTLEHESGAYGFSAKRTGPGRATVTMRLAGTIRYYGDPAELEDKMDDAIFVPGHEAQGFMHITDPNAPKPEVALYEARVSGYTTLYLKKVGGKWKIVQCDYAYIYPLDPVHVEGGDLE